MIDRAVMIRLLQTLRSYNAIPQPARELHISVNMSLTMPVSTATVIEHLHDAMEKGWVDRTRGALDDRYAITIPGRAAIHTLEQEGI
jgi:hypothetical protein